MVGAGLLGLSAACALSLRGWAVEVLEAADGIGHRLSGSKGDARIFRLGYLDPHYVAMAHAARTLWRELEERSDRELLHVTGQLSIGDPASLDALIGALAAVAGAAEPLNQREAAARFPDVALSGPAVYEPQSGVLAADECLLALCETGRLDIRTHTNVTRLEDDGTGVSVHCADRPPILSDVVVDCAGPGACALLGDGAPGVGAPPSRPQVAYFRAAPTSGVDPARLPVFIEWGDAMVYGLPVVGPGPRSGLFKVSHHTPGPPLRRYDPAAPDDEELEADDPALVHTLTDAVGRLLPGLDPVPVSTERCVYDNSVDTDLVLDRVGNIVVGCGTSGHGFKFGPLLGELLADLAEGAAPDFDLSPFRIDRGDRREPSGHGTVLDPGATTIREH